MAEDVAHDPGFLSEHRKKPRHGSRQQWPGRFERSVWDALERVIQRHAKTAANDRRARGGITYVRVRDGPWSRHNM